MSSSSSSSSSSPTTWKEGKSEELLAKTVLPLQCDSHKGSSGRIGVLGGSARYTGAPYYAAMASLRTGSDLAYVFCAREAAIPLKCYSPELMVAPVYSAQAFDEALKTQDTNQQDMLVENMVQEVVPMMDRMHVLIIGPGLGRCPLVMRAVAEIMQQAIDKNLAMVVDADALYMLTLAPYKDIFSTYEKVIWTPNVVEAKRLLAQSSASENDDDDENWKFRTKGIVIQKGHRDVIMSAPSSSPQGPGTTIICQQAGGMKRSGGLGDVLAGILGTFMAWNGILSSRDNKQMTDTTDRVLSCWTACCICKEATKRAFDKKKRSMTAPDVLEELGPAINDMTSEG